jgi:hypothetical protein
MQQIHLASYTGVKRLNQKCLINVKISEKARLLGQATDYSIFNNSNCVAAAEPTAADKTNGKMAILKIYAIILHFIVTN